MSKSPQNLLRRCSTMACEAGPRYRDGERHSHKTFPGGASTFFMATSKFRKRTNGLFFSHNFSSGQLIALLERCHFSHRTFRTALENTVYAALTHEKLYLRSAWKSYARKPASIAAKHLLCSEKFLENGEKYSEKRQFFTRFALSQKGTHK